MNNLDKQGLSRWLRRKRKPTEPHRDSRRPSAFIKVQPPFLEFCTAEGPVYVSERGASPSPIKVKVKVDNIRWNEAQTLHGATSNEQVYKVVPTPDGDTKVCFGDGVEGARIPSGAHNVRALYRTGFGAQGNLDAIMCIEVSEFGVRSVENPPPAQGGSDHETDIPERNAEVPFIEFLVWAGDMLSEYLDEVAKEAQLDSDRRRTSPRRHRALQKKLHSEVDRLNHLLGALNDGIANLQKLRK